jgi:hypothetical protein
MQGLRQKYFWYKMWNTSSLNTPFPNGGAICSHINFSSLKSAVVLVKTEHGCFLGFSCMMSNHTSKNCNGWIIGTPKFCWGFACKWNEVFGQNMTRFLYCYCSLTLLVLICLSLNRKGKFVLLQSVTAFYVILCSIFSWQT